MEFEYLKNRNSILEEKKEKQKERQEQQKLEEYYIKMGFEQDIIKVLSTAEEQGLISFEEAESEEEETKDIYIVIIDEEVPDYYDRKYMLSITPRGLPHNDENVTISLMHCSSRISTIKNINVLDSLNKKIKLSKIIDDLFCSLDKKLK